VTRTWLARVGRFVVACALAASGVAVGRFALRVTAPAVSAAVPEANAGPSTATTVRAEGRIVTYPNASVVVGTEIGGRLVRPDVEEQHPVKPGDLLAEVDASEQRAALVEARARVNEAGVAIKFLRSEVERARGLLAADALPRSALDKLQHDLDEAVARRAVASATAGRLAAAVAKTRVIAPIDGVVMERHVEPGETIAPGARIATVVDTKRMRVEVEVDEFDAADLKVGATAKVSAEGHAGSWRGRVEDVPDVVTTRRLKPQDPSRPTDARVLLVKVALEEPTPLRLGQRVEVAIGKRGDGT